MSLFSFTIIKKDNIVPFSRGHVSCTLAFLVINIQTPGIVRGRIIIKDFKTLALKSPGPFSQRWGKYSSTLFSSSRNL